MSRHQSPVYAIISHSLQLPSFDGTQPSFANFQDFALRWPKVAEILIPLHTFEWLQHGCQPVCGCIVRPSAEGATQGHDVTFVVAV
jgi:hypothetical protein